MTIKNMNQLESLLNKQIKKAMVVIAKKVEADMYNETYEFYTQGNPVMYIRTGALGDTPRVTAVNQTGKNTEFIAYLDKTHKYTTPNALDMGTVLELAENGDGGILGKPGFWNRTEKKIQPTINSVFKSFF